MAALAWAGGFVGVGALLPIAIFFAYRKREGSLARRHAAISSVLWILLFAIWIPLLLAMILLSDEGEFNPLPAVLIFILLLGLLIAASVVGVVKAFRAEVPSAAQPPPQMPPVPPPTY